MMFVLVITVAFGASLLTFFSGFGLGTLLLPVFALFFPPETAVAMTAIVHLLNNLFKFALMYRHVNISVLARFGIPAMIAAVVGAMVLKSLGDVGQLFQYEIATRTFSVTATGLTIGILLVAFAAYELLGWDRNRQLDRKWLPAGGVLSGFFGGLSGHQGALRSLFLLPALPDKRAFVATGVAIAVLIDVARLGVYSTSIGDWLNQSSGGMIVVATIAAAAGALVGKRLLNKVTIEWMFRMVGTLLMIAGFAIAAGLI